MTKLGMVGLAALAFVGVPVAAQEQPREEPRTITVNAMAQVERAPDRAVAMLAVESEGETAQAASQQNAQRMEAVIAALRNLGIQGEAVRTTSYQLIPEYVPAQRGETGRRIAGYRALNMVEVRVDSLPRLGAIVDAAIGAGANRVANLSFELRDSESARLEAIEQAVQKASREAEVVARAAGQRLGLPQSIQTSSDVPFPRPMYAARAMDMEVAQASTPVEPGTLRITANVTIVYRIEQP